MNHEPAMDESKRRKHNGKAKLNGGESPEEIERDLAKTRSELNDTLRAIEHRLSPGELVDQALDYMRGGPKEFAENLGHQARDNPMPVALMALSLGWLMFGSRKQQPSGGAYGYVEYGPEYTSEGIPESGPSTSERAHGMYESTTGSVREFGGAMGEKSGEMKERAKHRAEEARAGVARASERVRERAHSITSGMSHRGKGMASGMREGGYRARDTFSHYWHEQPLVLAALGLAVGAAFGAGIPATRKEQEALAPARERVSRVAEKGREEMAKAREDIKESVSSETGAPAGSPS